MPEEKANLSDFKLFTDRAASSRLLSITVELTARCNFNCRHCFICKGAGDAAEKAKEVSFETLSRFADDAADYGIFAVTLTGGEPLLREDFFDIYMMFKRKGFLVSLFTNAALIGERHIELFKKYPPHVIEVTVYGATDEGYERVTGVKNSCKRVMDALDRLDESHIPYRLKAMVINSNYDEFLKIKEFGAARTVDNFRFDPFLHLRYDHDEERNKMVLAEQLPIEKVLAAEKTDSARGERLAESCSAAFSPSVNEDGAKVFFCSAGKTSAAMCYDGRLMLCVSLYDDGCMYDYEHGSLKDFRENFVPRILNLRSKDNEYLESCMKCKYILVCPRCPAVSSLECGAIDRKVDRFCAVAKARYEEYSSNV